MNRRHALGILGLLPFAPRLAAAGPDASFWTKIPPTTNAILFVDVHAAYRSPLGQKEEWSKRYAETRHASLTSLPPMIGQILVASQYDLARLVPVRQISLMKTDGLITLEEIARSQGSTIEKVAGTSAVRWPRDAYFTHVGVNQLAAFCPANRQEFGRWMDYLNSGGFSVTSNYLRKAVDDSGNATVVVAADLNHAIDNNMAKALFEYLPEVKKNNGDATGLARLFTGLKGFTLTATITDHIATRLRIDFSESPQAFEPYLHKVVDELLADSGTMIDEFKDWTPSVNENSMILEGRISSVSLKRIVSLFELFGDVGRTQLGEKGDAADQATTMAIASRRYYKALDQSLRELRNVKFKDNYNRYASWFESYTRQIEKLSTQDVDPELAAFGSAVVRNLRAISASLRGVPMQLDALGNTAYAYNTGYVYDRWGAYGGNTATNLGEVRAKQQEVTMKDNQARIDLWTKVDDQMAALKTKLSAKYRMPF